LGCGSCSAFEQDQTGAGLLNEHSSFFGKRESARGSIEQANAQGSFQRGDVFAHGRRGEIECLCGGRETTVLRNVDGAQKPRERRLQLLHHFSRPRSDSIINFWLRILCRVVPFSSPRQAA
jgi:hypothetical protein